MKSLGTRCGMERAPRWLQRQPFKVRQRACAPLTVGRFSTGQSARGPRGTGLGSYAREHATPDSPHGVNPLKWSLGQRRGMESAPRWLQRQPRKLSQRARAPWAVGRFSIGRSARGPRRTEFGSFEYDISKQQPPAWRGVGEDEPRHTVWGGGRPAWAAKTTTPTPPASLCSVVGRLVLHKAKRVRATGHGIQKPWSSETEAEALNLERVL